MPKSALYTVIMDFKGGVYIEQVKATSPSMAIKKWAKTLDPSVVFGLGPSTKASILNVVNDKDKDLSGLPPVLLDGLTHAWCTNFCIGKNHILLNVIKTEVSS